MNLSGENSKMNKPKTFEVHLSLRVVNSTSTYDNKTLAKFDLTEVVPSGIEPVDHLRNLLKSNFNRVFGPISVLTIEQSEELV